MTLSLLTSLPVECFENVTQTSHKTQSLSLPLPLFSLIRRAETARLQLRIKHIFSTIIEVDEINHTIVFDFICQTLFTFYSVSVSVATFLESGLY